MMIFVSGFHVLALFQLVFEPIFTEITLSARNSVAVSCGFS